MTKKRVEEVKNGPVHCQSKLILGGVVAIPIQLKVRRYGVTSFKAHISLS